MPKALFFNIPAHGHINPSLPLITELTRRGHEITYFTTETYRKRVEAAGATVQLYRNLEDDYFEQHGLNGSEPQKAAQLLLTTTQTLLPELLEITRQAQVDYILFDCMCPWGYYLSRIVGLPSVASFSLMPLTMHIMRDWQLLQLFLPGLFRDFALGMQVNRLAQELGKQYGVKPLGMMEVLNARGDLSISYSIPEYVPYAQALPASFRFVGWTMLENVVGDPFTKQSNTPLIYVSLGTVSNDNADFYRLCIEAFTNAPYEILISTGGRLSPEQFGNLPANITIKSWVPQTQVLQQAALFITHGGLNSLHDGLYCSLPMLIVPQQVEQTFNGLRVTKLGAGLMLKPHELTAAALRTRVTTLLADGRYKTEAVRIGNLLRVAGGAARAVDEIETLIGKTNESI